MWLRSARAECGWKRPESERGGQRRWRGPREGRVFRRSPALFENRATHPQPRPQPPSCLSVKRRRLHCAPAPRCTRTQRPPTVFRFPAPTCHRAVPPPRPPPPVSGRQLQLCPLLSEQLDSDAQSRKPLVGMSFLSLCLLLPVAPPYPPPRFPVRCPPSLPHFLSLLSSQGDMVFSPPACQGFQSLVPLFAVC